MLNVVVPFDIFPLKSREINSYLLDPRILGYDLLNTVLNVLILLPVSLTVKKKIFSQVDPNEMRYSF